MPGFGVNVVVLRDSAVLLTLRSDVPVWCLPGGAVEAGETLAQAAIREALEETGAEIEISGLVGVYSRPNWRTGGNHEIVFLARQVGGDLFPHDGEAVEIAYFGLAELPKSLLWWHHERIFDAVASKQVVARMQDARWPLDGVDYEEVKRLVVEDERARQELVDYFCTKPSDEASFLELGGVDSEIE